MLCAAFAVACLALGGGDAPPISAFTPSKHGFVFRNAFSGSPLPGVLANVPGLGGVGPSRFGLCGGMSTAAADYYLAGRTPPVRDQPPARGDGLYDYLYERQTDSLGTGLGMAAVFAGWMRAPDAGWLGTQHATATTIGGVLAALGEEKPVILGLVYAKAGDGRALWENHQVLATRAERVEDGRVVLHIYDPNYPKRDDVRVVCTPVVTGHVELPGVVGVRVPVMGWSCREMVGTRAAHVVRGFFSMPYTPKAPPATVRAPEGVTDAALAAIVAETARLGGWKPDDADAQEPVRRAAEAYQAILLAVAEEERFKGREFKEPNEYLIRYPYERTEKEPAFVELELAHAERVFAEMERCGVLAALDEACGAKRVDAALRIEDGELHTGPIVHLRRLGVTCAAMAASCTERGDIAGAVSNIRRALAIARCLSWSPMLITATVSEGIDRRASEEVMALARSRGIDAGHLRRLIAVLDEQGARCPLGITLKVMRADIPSWIWQRVQPEGVIREAYGKRAERVLKDRAFMDGLTGREPPSQQTTHHIDVTSLVEFGLAEFDFGAREGQQPPGTWSRRFWQLRHAEEQAKDYASAAAVLTASMVPRFAEVEWKRMTNLAAARTVVAIELFKCETGRLPAALEELVPKYLEAVPRDPWSDGPICYRRLDPAEIPIYGRTYILYSTGSDRADNNGRMAYSPSWMLHDMNIGLDFDLNPPRGWRPPEEMSSTRFAWPPPVKEPAQPPVQ